jgi:hypothetical protein
MRKLVPFAAVLLASLFIVPMGYGSTRYKGILGSSFEAPPDEIEKDAEAASYIRDVIVANDGAYECVNFYGNYTTWENIRSVAHGQGYSFSTSFYIGHGNSQYWYGETHYFIVAENGVQVLDNDIYCVTDNRYTRFTFLWSCLQGNTIGWMYPSGTACGMPNAWLHTTMLSVNGYASPDYGGYTFIGFMGGSPYLTYDFDADHPDTGYNFLKLFYKGVFEYRLCIKGALDYASMYTWPEYPRPMFDDTVFYNGYTIGGDSGRMMVYGDGCLWLHSEGLGGGGCPILHVFDGSKYISEGLLNIHNANSTDVVRKHTLITIPQSVKHAYLLRLTEHYKTDSHIDQVKLYAVLDNKIMINLPLIKAWHSEYGNVLPQLLFSDELKTETKGAEHNNGISQSIDLKFLSLPPGLEPTCFVFLIEGYNDEVK